MSIESFSLTTDVDNPESRLIVEIYPSNLDYPHLVIKRPSSNDDILIFMGEVTELAEILLKANRRLSQIESQIIEESEGDTWIRANLRRGLEGE